MHEGGRTESGFTIFPAIDLKGGLCVRLRQGREDDAKVYSDDPVRMAMHWQEAGGRYLHVVDLDGAFRGRPAHTEVIRAIAAAVDMPVEVGGGLRTDEDIDRVLAAGAARAIIGTRAMSDETVLASLVARYAERLVVGVDARDGRVQVRGWVETTDVPAVELVARMDALGVRTIIYTDTATDGMLVGPNLRAVERICHAVRCDVVASGGVSSVEDVRALRSMGLSNLCGAIVGKALYEGRVTLGELTEGSAP